jgi:hypothetical protein
MEVLGILRCETRGWSVTKREVGRSGVRRHQLCRTCKASSLSVLRKPAQNSVSMR